MRTVLKEVPEVAAQWRPRQPLAHDRSVQARRRILLILPLALAALTACGASGGDGAVAARWAPFVHLPGVVDLAGPRSDGSFLVAAAGHLSVLSRTGVLSPFARGPGGYSTPSGTEPYITVTPASLAGDGCAFGEGAAFALEPRGNPGVIMIGPRGQAQRFASLPRDLFPDGIAFDTVGRFQHRLLVTATGHGGTRLFAISCTAGVSVVTARGPSVEGGIAVAPASFGRFGGDVIAPSETSGRLYAFLPDGKTVMAAESGLPAGVDTGIESAGFIPPGFTSAADAYLADRVSGGAHSGTNHILRLPGQQLARAGARPGDLLVAAEGGAKTILVRCGTSCTVTHIADGPAPAHGEGHIVFAAP